VAAILNLGLRQSWYIIHKTGEKHLLEFCETWLSSLEELYCPMAINTTN
jgi:hypothetical protein